MVLLMGSKEEDVPAEPAVKPVFMEDMNESELASAVNFSFSCLPSFMGLFLPELCMER